MILQNVLFHCPSSLRRTETENQKAKTNKNQAKKKMDKFMASTSLNICLLFDLCNLSKDITRSAEFSSTSKTENKEDKGKRHVEIEFASHDHFQHCYDFKC
jgi:hypothetical protein